jgi:hypothetical protein
MIIPGMFSMHPPFPAPCPEHEPTANATTSAAIIEVIGIRVFFMSASSQSYSETL